MPYAHCKGILYGTMTVELGGKVIIECEKSSYVTELEFKLKPFFGGSASINQISGKIKSEDEVLASLDGHWDGEVYLNDLKNGTRNIFWNPTSDIRKQRLKRHIVVFEEQTEFESERLWEHVTSAINEGDQNKATEEKYMLEEAQRKGTRERKENGTEWSPKLFTYDVSGNEWQYKYEE
ncbi:oxysterol-binding protein-related protein 5 [Microcaecilia unicolor]|uniref:Oxysterol-binding protein-related protein 5 n=1 Tax=Microcaecilia unicolor TaxID=1415580 RepID=A0A6P7XZK4_9AMPH|nr:oxysterol-binding protein-related protein 5 [Microcaecilia unicolor]